MKIDAVILAASENNDKLKQYEAEYEALIELEGIPMVKYVIEAVNNSQLINKVAMIGPVLSDHDIIFSSSESVSIIGNVKEGVGRLDVQDYILIITSDIPLITFEMIDDFINRCLQYGEDIYYPIVPRKVMKKEFPGNQKTYIRTSQGFFTGGNFILIKRENIENLSIKAEKFITYRKKPWKILKLLGIQFLIKYFFRSLSVKAIEKRMTSILGCKSKAIVINDAEAGMDIDKPEDFVQICEKL